MMFHQVQVEKEHYARGSYRSSERWSSYWHQLALVRETLPQSVLEVGVGEGVVARELSRGGIAVTTLDIAQDLHPDVVGSVTNIPFPPKSFDTVLAAEVLEHIPFSDVPMALSEIARVARKAIVISLPCPGYVFSFVVKIPLLPRIEFFFKIPFFWKRHQFDGQHYWELGKRDFSVQQFLTLAREAGFTCKRTTHYADDPAHRFFLFSVRT